MLDIAIDRTSNQHSCQFPDIWVAMYPSGKRVKPITSETEKYRGALLVRKGDEHIHLNALDIGDVLTFLADTRIDSLRKRITSEYAYENILRLAIIGLQWSDITGNKDFPAVTDHEI